MSRWITTKFTAAALAGLGCLGALGATASFAADSQPADANPWTEKDLSRADLGPPMARAADYLLRTELASLVSSSYVNDPLGRCCRKTSNT